MTRIVGASDGALVLDDGRRVALVDTHGWRITGTARVEIDGDAHALWAVAPDAVAGVIAHIDALKEHWPPDLRGIGARRTEMDGAARIVTETVRLLRDVDGAWPEDVRDGAVRSLAAALLEVTAWPHVRAHRGALPGFAARFALGNDPRALSVELTRVVHGAAHDEVEVRVLMADTRTRWFGDDAADAVRVVRALAEERLAVVHDLDDAWWCPIRGDGSLDVDALTPSLARGGRATVTSWTTLPPLVHTAHATFNRRARPDELAALRARTAGLGARVLRAASPAVKRVRTLLR